MDAAGVVPGRSAGALGGATETVTAGGTLAAATGDADANVGLAIVTWTTGVVVLVVEVGGADAGVDAPAQPLSSNARPTGRSFTACMGSCLLYTSRCV